MKFLATTVSLFIAGFLFSSFKFHSTNGNLKIRIDNVQVEKGTIWIGLYSSKKDFLNKEKAIIKGVKVEKNGSHYVEIPQLAYGAYAVAIFQDVNDNGELDLNFVGIPSEPFAFSKPPKSKWRLPKFDEVKFRFYRKKQTLITKLKKWWD